jgi:hypothetical protein
VKRRGLTSHTVCVTGVSGWWALGSDVSWLCQEACRCLLPGLPSGAWLGVELGPAYSMIWQESSQGPVVEPEVGGQLGLCDDIVVAFCQVRAEQKTHSLLL